MIDALIADLTDRFAQIVAPKRGKPHTAKAMAEVVDPADAIGRSIPVIIQDLVSKKPMVSTCRKVGTEIIMAYPELSIFMKDPVAAVHFGSFVIESFVNEGKLDKKMQHNGKNQIYHLIEIEGAGILELWENAKGKKLPAPEPYPDWTTYEAENGLPLIKQVPLSVLMKLHPTQQPHVFASLNKMQRTGWMVNRDILPHFTRASNNARTAKWVEDGKTYSCFSFTTEENRKSKKSKRREALSIKAIAHKMIDTECEPFYHQYNCDFRGRIYPNTAFFHEQGSDNAKGLLLLAEGEPLGKDGLRWLCMHTANCWGNDKIPLDDRAQFTIDNQDEFIAYARDPFNTRNRKWMMADSPWEFLAACNELRKISEFDGNPEDYICHLPIYIDGSNNGVQWMTALARDEVVAPLVNLVPQDLPGDVYMHIAEKTWEQITPHMDETLRDEFKSYQTELVRLSSLVDTAPNKKEREEVLEKLAKLRDEVGKDKRDKFAYLFWGDILNPKEQRRTCKRPVMTLGYGGTKNGFCQQIRDDTAEISPEFNHMDFRWSSMMGFLIHDTCYEHLPGAAKMLTLFQEVSRRALGDEAETRFSWTVPITQFPVLQTYMQQHTKQIRLKFCGDEIRLSLQYWDKKVVSKKDQTTGAAPNIVHSFDAAHLQMVVSETDYATPTVHDSFGCLPSRMTDYFLLVREKFVEFNSIDPLAYLLAEHGSLDLMPERGQLNLNMVLESDYAFA